MNPVTLTTLIARVRSRANIGGATLFIPDSEITDHLNGSLAIELYDLVRQSVGDQYYRKTYLFSTNPSQPDPSIYDLPGDFAAIISVDCYLTAQTGASAPRANARRYMEEERNLYLNMPIGWSYGELGWILYSLVGNQIRLQPAPPSAMQVGLNYVPVAPKLVNPGDTWDDLNGWSEVAVLDAASKCCLKMRLADMVQLLDQKRDRLEQKIRALIPLRHAGEPERPHYFNRRNWGDGWEPGW